MAVSSAASRGETRRTALLQFGFSLEAATGFQLPYDPWVDLSEIMSFDVPRNFWSQCSEWGSFWLHYSEWGSFWMKYSESVSFWMQYSDLDSCWNHNMLLQLLNRHTTFHSCGFFFGIRSVLLTEHPVPCCSKSVLLIECRTDIKWAFHVCAIQFENLFVGALVFPYLNTAWNWNCLED
jgi:hypothetical protein